MESSLSKMAVQTLHMSEQEYLNVRQNSSLEELLANLSRRARQINVPFYDLQSLHESLVKDHAIASRTHWEWQPAKARNYIAKIWALLSLICPTFFLVVRNLCKHLPCM